MNDTENWDSYEPPNGLTLFPRFLNPDISSGDAETKIMITYEMPSYAMVRRDRHTTNHGRVVINVSREMYSRTSGMQFIMLYRQNTHFDLNGTEDLDETWIREYRHLQSVFVRDLDDVVNNGMSGVSFMEIPTLKLL